MARPFQFCEISCFKLGRMELLLNLVWITLALGGLLAFEQRRRASARIAQLPYLKALIVLACVIVLLFPIVSASDDLRPTPAVLEDATKRIQHVFAPLPHAQSRPFAAILPALLVLQLLLALVALQAWRPHAIAARVLQRERIPRAGRSPPASRPTHLVAPRKG